MLRISVLNEPGVARLKLEGKLAHEWVGEAQKAWTALAAICEGIEVVVDLMDVSFVDDAGYQLLAHMRHAGAELSGHGPMISALIDQIEEAEVEAEQEPGEDWPEPVTDRKELEQ